MKNLSLFLMGLCILALHSCQQGDAGKIITVNGPIDPAALGTVLTHEHILVDFIGADSTGYHRWNKDTVLRVMLPYLEECKASRPYLSAGSGGCQFSPAETCFQTEESEAV